MIVPIEMHGAQCDCCGEAWTNDEGFMAHADEVSMWNALNEEREWFISLAGKHYCPNCWYRDEKGGIMISNAQISPCEKYRYSLTRIWDDSKAKVLFVMLNPSTADGKKNDPTIRRCIGFAKSWGYGGLYVGNLLSYRTSNPKELKNAEDLFGAENEAHLKEMAKNSDLLVCAWGNPALTGIIMHETRLIRSLGLTPHYLELTIDGTPKHPLYLKSELKPIPFRKFLKATWRHITT